MPAQSVAASRDCDVIAALASDSHSETRKFAIDVTNQDRVDLLYKGKAGLFRGANGCGIIPAKDDFELQCEWDFADARGKASALFSAYRIRINECLAVPFEPSGTNSYGKRTILEKYQANIEHSNGTETFITLRFAESRYGSTPRYTVQLAVERD